MLDFFTKGVGRVSGLFTIEHLIFVALGFSIVFLVLRLTRNYSNDKILKRMKVVAIVFFILEILKIIWNITVRENATINDYIPLYFCSLFMYANLGYCFIKNKESKFRQFCLIFLFYGGISGGIGYLLYPSTALLIFPFLHVLSFHSLFYHSFMIICAIWSLRELTPTKSDVKLYFRYLLTLEVIVLIVNYILGTNYMLLNRSFGMPILDAIYNAAPIIYPFISSLGQIIITYYPCYYLYKLIMKIRDSRSQKLKEEND